MLVKELIDALEELGVPDDAKVFVEADHGQNKEVASAVVVSRWPRDDDYFGDPTK